MKTESILILTREDIKPGFEDIRFKNIQPCYLTDEAVEEMKYYAITLFINTTMNQKQADIRTKLLKNDYGLYGTIIPAGKL